MTRHCRAAALALAAAVLLAGCSSSSDDSTSDTPPASGSDTSTEAGTEPAEDDAAQPDGAADGDLSPGDTHTWDDGVSLTVGQLTEYTPTAEDAPFVPEGETPFIAPLTIANGSAEPVDIADLAITADGITTGGMLTGAYFDGVTDLPGGRVAPGAETTITLAWTIDEAAHGRDVAIAALRVTETMLAETPTWSGTIVAP
ncbi:hypothetical protein [Streptomyces xiamenensis]|uniref:hypothetical protein n=1 Tax=Streptomyces xiamenensis TaxID=408015 RepID=UPI003D75F8FB